MVILAGLLILIHNPCRVATDTTWQVVLSDACFVMDLLDLIGLVIMAVVAGVFKVIFSMTGLAVQLLGRISQAMIDWENVLA